MQALATPSRVRILSRLGAGPCSVGELARAVGMEQPAVSQQLRVLRHLGLVVGERDGRQVIYALHDDHVRALLDRGGLAHRAPAARPRVAARREQAVGVMSSTGPALLAAAAGVGFGHAILPDHWVPLAVLGRTRRYPLSRVARLSGLAGVAHVLVSIVLGAVIIAVGLQFRSTIQSAQDTIIGCLLIATGDRVRRARAHRPWHTTHDHDGHDRQRRSRATTHDGDHDHHRRPRRARPPCRDADRGRGPGAACAVWRR